MKTEASLSLAEIKLLPIKENKLAVPQINNLY